MRLNRFEGMALRNVQIVIAGLTALALSAAQPTRADSGMSAGDAVIHAPMPGAEAAAAYLRIENASASDDRLLGASSPSAGKIELHKIEMEGAVARMRQVLYGVKIPAHTTVNLTPATMHLMIINPRVPLSPGAAMPLELTFQRAGRIKVVATVQAPGADSN